MWQPILAMKKLIIFCTSLVVLCYVFASVDE